MGRGAALREQLSRDCRQSARNDHVTSAHKSFFVNLTPNSPNLRMPVTRQLWEHRVLARCIYSYRRAALAGNKRTRLRCSVSEIASAYYGQFSENPRTIPLARFSFPPAPSLLGSESSANPPRICRESVANRWKIDQENSLGQSSVRLPGRYRAWLLGQRGAIAAPIICELPGNCGRIYFLAEGSNGVPAPAIYLHSIRQKQRCPEFWLALVRGTYAGRIRAIGRASLTPREQIAPESRRVEKVDRGYTGENTGDPWQKIAVIGSIHLPCWRVHECSVYKARIQLQ